MGVYHCADGMCVEMHDRLRNAMVGSCQLSKIPISLYDGSVSRMTLNLTQADMVRQSMNLSLLPGGYLKAISRKKSNDS